MEYRRFGRTNLQVSLTGLGTGGPSQLGQRTGVDTAGATRLVRRALDLGINLIDTAAAYGDSELRLGEALQGVPRDSYVLATKAHPYRKSGGQQELLTEQELIDSVERSLTRLRVDYVDVFQFHAVTPETYPHTRDVLLPVLQHLRDQGKMRFIGLTESFAVDHIRETFRLALADDVWDTFLVGYNLLTPGPEDDVLPLAAKQDVGVMIMCAVRRRIARPEALTELVRELQRAGEIPGDIDAERPLDWLLHDGVESVSEAAYRYASGNPQVGSVLTGTANTGHLEANVAAMQKGDLPAADRTRLREIFAPVGRKLGE